MKCPNCNEEIGECKICPFCKNEISKKETNTSEKNIPEQIKHKDRTITIIIFKYILIAIIGVFALIEGISGNFIIMLSCILSAVGLYIILTIFEIIIDLLQEIKEKI